MQYTKLTARRVLSTRQYFAYKVLKAILNRLFQQLTGFGWDGKITGAFLIFTLLQCTVCTAAVSGVGCGT